MEVSSTTDRPGSVEPTTALLVVPHGTFAPQQLAAAVRHHQPSWAIEAVWCGDPQLRPSLPPPASWRSIRDGSTPEHTLLNAQPERNEWRRALIAAGDVLDAGAARVVVLFVGSVAVLGPLGALASGAMAVVPRVFGAIPDDGLVPTEADLLAGGRFSTSVVSFTTEARKAIEWLSQMIVDERLPVGRWLERSATLFAAAQVTHPSIGAGRWRWNDPVPALIDVPELDAEQPWTLDPTERLQARVTVARSQDRLATIVAAAPQLRGARTPISLPGGLRIDDLMRVLVGASSSPVPAPWSEAAAFRRWLGPRYWAARRAARPDLVAAFPDPDGASADAFRSWTSTAFVSEGAPMLLSPARRDERSLSVADPRRRDGLNLCGYQELDFSLGDVARRLGTALHAAHVPVTTIAATRSASPQLPGAARPDQRIDFTTTLAVVTADQLPYQLADHPELFAASERMIGYWFWELEHIPASMRESIRLVDEIWAGSRFVTESFTAVTDIPVRHVPIPIAEPHASALGREDFEPLRGLGDRLLFLVTLDHFSITERKNPLGAIEAFRRAFTPGEGPVLVVKSMNAAGRWPQHERVVAAAVDRADIIVWDQHLARDDQMALIASADCLVSLHRSEGLGLHLAEAMWLGTPTIATRYSGNLDFMDDECSMLIDAGRVHVTDGQGIYPAAAMWADPDLDQAAAAMRRLASDPLHGRRLAEDARAKMAMQPTLAATGEHIARLLSEGG